MTHRLAYGLVLVPALAAAGCDTAPISRHPIEILEPLDGDIVSGRIAIRARHGVTALDELIVRVNGAVVGATTDDSIVAWIDTSAHPDGELALEAEVLSDGRSSTHGRRIAVTSDNSPPTTAISGAPGAFVEDGETFEITLDVADVAGIRKVGIHAAAGDIDIAQRVDEPDGPVSFSFRWEELSIDPTALPADITLSVAAVDKLDQASVTTAPFRAASRAVWTHNVAGLMVRPPVVSDDGTVWVGATKVSPDDGRLVHLDAQGQQLCELLLPAESLYAVAEAGELVVFGTSRALRAARVTDCSLAWTYGDLEGAPVTYWGTPIVDAARGLVHAVTVDGRLVSVVLETGEERRTVEVGAEVQSSAVLGPGGELLVGSVNSMMYGFDADGAALPWSPYPTAGALFGDPVISGGTLYFGSSDGVLYALNIATGEPEAGFGVASPDGFPIRGVPAIAPDGSIVVGTVGGSVWAVDGEGSVLWEAEAGSVSRGGPVVVGDGYGGWVAHVGSTDGKVYAVDQDGERVYARPMGGAMHTYGASGNGVLYMPADDYHLHATRVRLPE